MSRFDFEIMNDLSARINDINQAAVNPSYWSLANLGIDLYDNQVEILDAVLDLSLPYIAILASRGSGKTYAVAIAIVKMCLDNPGFRVGVFGPKADTSKRLVKEDIIGRILTPSSKVYDQIDWNHTSNTFIQFKNGSTVKALSASPTATQESEHFSAIILDECVVGNSVVTLADGNKKTIKEIVDQKIPIKVLSFDEKQNKLVEADVIDFKKIPLKKQLLEIEFEDGKTIKCTEDHKFYTKNRGWIEAKNLTEKDDIVNIKVCVGCSITFIPLKNAKFCTNKCYIKWFEKNKRKEERICQQCKKPFQAVIRADAQFCSYSCEKTRLCKYCQKSYIRIGQEKYCSKECKKAARLSRSKPRTGCLVCGKLSRDRDTKHCMKHNNWTETTGVPVINKCKNCEKEFTVIGNRQLTCSQECQNILNSIRMTQYNPTDNPETVKKMKESLKTFFEENPDKLAERLKNFKTAPVYTRGKITSPERTIIAMSIPNLKYTGDGTRWVKFSTGKNKNPDFSFENSNKVVEVGDFNYWYTKEETDEVVRLYKEKKIDCLYLDADFVNENPLEAEKQIRSFLCI